MIADIVVHVTVGFHCGIMHQIWVMYKIDLDQAAVAGSLADRQRIYVMVKFYFIG